jgi:predicted amidohydrolase YtcJ
MQSRIVGLFLFCLAVQSQAQQIPAQLIQYPDTIYHNGKVVTVDEQFSIVEALAVRDGKIIMADSTQKIMALAGPNTRKVDLRGRTVLPGLIDTHLHLHDYALYHWAPEIAPEVANMHMIEENSSEEILHALHEAVKTDIPADLPDDVWVVYGLRGGLDDASVKFSREVTRSDLDEVDPAHPLLIYPENAGPMVNSQGLDNLLDRVPAELLYLEQDNNKEYNGRMSVEALPLIDEVLTNVLHEEEVGRETPPRLRDSLAKVYKKELEEWASYGVTTWSSKMHTIGLSALTLLEQRGELPIRLAYSIESFKSDVNPEDAAELIPDTTGYGTPYLWMNGFSFSGDGSFPDPCSSFPSSYKHLENCKFPPGSDHFNDLVTAVKYGFRIANTHVAGDRAADHLILAIEMGSKAAGMTLEEIRAKKHALDHCTLNPRPDHIEKGKQLGLLWSCGPKYILRARLMAELFGREVADAYAVPTVRLIEAGFKPAFHSDGHHVGPMIFYYLQLLVTRKDVQSGEVWGADQAVDRKVALTMATRWGADYVLRANELGSLEPGKYADFIVIDRDYMTVPVEDISKIRVLMTVVGDKTVYSDQKL